MHTNGVPISATLSDDPVGLLKVLLIVNNYLKTLVWAYLLLFFFHIKWVKLIFRLSVWSTHSNKLSLFHDKSQIITIPYLDFRLLRYALSVLEQVISPEDIASILSFRKKTHLSELLRSKSLGLWMFFFKSEFMYWGGFSCVIEPVSVWIS